MDSLPLDISNGSNWLAQYYTDFLTLDKHLDKSTAVKYTIMAGWVSPKLPSNTNLETSYLSWSAKEL